MSPSDRLPSVLRVALAAALVSSLAVATESTRRSAPNRATGPLAVSVGTLGGSAGLTFVGPGADFVQSSRTTRTLGVGAHDPLVLPLPALPHGATEVQSFASWNFVDTSSSIGPDTITVNGVVVTGAHVDGEEQALCTVPGAYLDTWVADVTGLLDHGGPNVLVGVCDKPLWADPSALGSGITLVTVYQFAYGSDREVELWAGISSTGSTQGGDVDVTFDLSTPWSYLDLHFGLNAVGGDQGFSDRFEIDGHDATNVLAGLHTSTDAWAGELGPLASGNKYDFAEGDLSAWLAAGATQFTASTLTGTDCIGHTLAIASHPIECGDVATYCTSKVNSLGCAPFVDTTGKPSESSGLPFRIRGFDFRNNKNGLLFYGHQPLAAPFQGGHLCVKAPIERTAVQNSGGNVGTNDCSGVYSYDFNALIRLGTDAELVPGATVFAQYWARDPDDVFTTSLSDAVAFDICP